MFSYYLMKAFSAIACLLPRSVCEALGRGLGNFAWLVLPAKRKVLAQSQIQTCLQVDEAEARRIAKASAVRFGPMLFEVLRFPLIKKKPQE